MMGDRRDRTGSGRPGRDRRRRRPEADLHGQHAVRPRTRRSRWKRSASRSRSSRRRSSRTRTTDETKLAEALGKMVRDDPTLKFHTDAETKQLILQRHGRAAPGSVGRQAACANPGRQGRRSASRWSPTGRRWPSRSSSRRATSSSRAAAASTPSSTCATSRSTRSGIEEWSRELEEEGEKPDPNNIYFVDEIFGGVVPREYIPSVEDGFRDWRKKGRKYGFPFVDMRGDAVRRQVPRRRLVAGRVQAGGRSRASATPRPRRASCCSSRS